MEVTMSKLIQILQEEKEYLEQIRGKVEENINQDHIDKLPGKLRIQKKGNSVQYYHTDISRKHEIHTQEDCSVETKHPTKDKENQFNDVKSNQENLTKQHQTYIPKKNIVLVRNLAQRDYDNKLIREIEQRQKILNRFIDEYPHSGLEEVYAAMNDYRRELIQPIIETDEQYAKIWINTPYVRKIVGDDVPEIFTENGERVRSKSEKMIADKLKHLNIPYRYEAPLRLGRSTVLHPDFTLLNVKERKEIYYEHFGMMDNPEYIGSALNRIALYEKNGIFPGDKLLFSWETMAMPLNMKIVEGMLKKFV